MTFDDATRSDLGSMTFCVVDVETSGLRPERHRVLQIGAVVVTAQGTVLRQWSTLVRPANRWFFRLGPRHIHGLSRRALRHAPPMRTALAQLADHLAGATFTAHNAQFDLAFLQQAAARANVELPVSDPLCTLRLSRQLDPERALSHRLGDVCARYQVQLERPHDALDDALATALVLPHLLQAHNITTAEQVTALSESASSGPASAHE